MTEKKVIDYVGLLARINLTDQEKQSLDSQLSKILEYVEKLKELDVDNVEPLRGLHLEHNIFRNDEVKSFSSADDILHNAPLREGSFFKIPKVIE